MSWALHFTDSAQYCRDEAIWKISDKHHMIVEMDNRWLRYNISLGKVPFTLEK